MKGSCFTETQIFEMFQEAVSGRPVEDVCGKHVISDVGESKYDGYDLVYQNNIFMLNCTTGRNKERVGNHLFEFIRRFMQRPLNIFVAEAKAHEFDRIISLGCNCELALNIRAYFGIERAYPFDWWITPFQALWKLLEDRFHDLFNINHLEVSSDLLTVRDKHYNLLYHHDFQKTEDEIVIPDIIEQQIPLLKQKYDMLIHRFFKDLQNKKVLFIRNRDGNIPHLDRDTTPMNENTFGQLYDLLEKLFPDSAISLLITNCPVHASIQRKNGCIVWDEVNYHHDDYQFFIGSRRGWQDMFSRNNIFYAGAGVSNPLK